MASGEVALKTIGKGVISNGITEQVKLSAGNKKKVNYM